MKKKNVVRGQIEWRLDVFNEFSHDIVSDTRVGKFDHLTDGRGNIGSFFAASG
jgi:hypothetical protein